MISDLDRSLGSRYFLNVVNERVRERNYKFRVDHLFGIHF